MSFMDIVFSVLKLFNPFVWFGRIKLSKEEKNKLKKLEKDAFVKRCEELADKRGKEKADRRFGY